MCKSYNKFELDTEKYSTSVCAVQIPFILKDTIDFKVLHYQHSKLCDSITYASEAIGVNLINNDTIRIISLCNSDTTIKPNMIIKIIPESMRMKPNKVIIMSCSSKLVGRRYYTPEIFNKPLLTTYGQILK